MSQGTFLVHRACRFLEQAGLGANEITCRPYEEMFRYTLKQVKEDESIADSLHIEAWENEGFPYLLGEAERVQHPDYEDREVVLFLEVAYGYLLLWDGEQFFLAKNTLSTGTFIVFSESVCPDHLTSEKIYTIYPA